MRYSRRELAPSGRFRRRDWMRMMGLAWLVPTAGQHWAVARSYGTGCIFVTSNVDNRNGLIAYNPEDGTWTSILEDCDARPRVAPDGKRVAFQRRGAIWIAELGGERREHKILDLNGPTSGSPPVWSGDGKQLILSPAVRDEARNHWRFETFRFDASGLNKVALAVPDTDGVHDWSPDGAWVVTVSSRNATLGWTLYRMRPDGTMERRLTEGGNPFSVRYSPDGKRLLYDDGGSDEKRGVWIMGADGQSPKRIYARAKGTTSSSCWSPDGKRIAVVICEVEGRNRGDAKGRLVILNTDGETRASYPLADEKTSHADMPDWR